MHFSICRSSDGTSKLHVCHNHETGEFELESTAEESSVVQREGIRNARIKVRFYNLDVIISVGYRVKCRQETQFRQWATRVLRNHVVKGYSLIELRFREQAEKLFERPNY